MHVFFKFIKNSLLKTDNIRLSWPSGLEVSGIDRLASALFSFAYCLLRLGGCIVLYQHHRLTALLFTLCNLDVSFNLYSLYPISSLCFLQMSNCSCNKLQNLPDWIASRMLCYINGQRKQLQAESVNAKPFNN